MKIKSVFILYFLGGLFISLHGQIVLHEKMIDPFGEIHYIDSLKAQSVHYLENGEYEKSLKCEPQIFWNYKRILSSRISHLSENQVNTFFENNTLDDRANIIYSLLWHYPVDMSINLSYEYTLFSKLFLLNTIKSIRSNDLLKTNDYSIFSILLSKHLGDNEAIVDFIKFRLIDKQTTDSIMYGAFLLRKNYKNPIFIPLFEENSLKTILLKDSINEKQDSVYVRNLYEQKGKRLYQLIWQPLEKYLSANDTVYYSLSGFLNKISFAALPADSSCLSDKYNLHLVSHPHEIIDMKDEVMYQKLQFYLDLLYAQKLFPEKIDDIRKKSMPNDAAILWKEIEAFLKEYGFDPDSLKLKPFHSAVEYGGIIYDADDKKLLTAAAHAQPTQTNLFAPDTIIRSNMEYLEGSAEEVNEVEELLNQEKIPNIKFMGLQATEESFKQLSGNSPELLHIATHGFFLEDEKQISENGFMKTMNSRNQTYINPLLRSGLLFAGANRAWIDDEVLPGIEDGILTAEEISHLDLSKTKLVVLSACETGLGEVENSEGVFGLQRAFKLAGVQTIVMSLWKVPDEATSKLMIDFYQNLLSGKSKEESFKKAQQTVRQEYPNPYCWAGFVMMD